MQIFLFEKETFLGNVNDVSPSIEINFLGPDANQFRCLCTPILSVPYYPGVQLLLSGEFLVFIINKKRNIN